ncbi:MAG: O-methyltransferase [Bacteroidota bacterium]
MRDFFPKDLIQYVDEHSETEPEDLYHLRRETHVKVLYPQMLSPAGQGRLLSFFSQLLRPKRILEIGTFTGYSCLCMAEGLAEDGQIVTIEVNPERERLIRKWVCKRGMEQVIDLRFGPALEVLPEVAGPFDWIFLDADKANYPAYYELAMPKLRPGGLLIADNVLWHGKVVDQSATDKETLAIRAFNRMVQADTQAQNLLLPAWDGLMLVKKLG